MLTTAETWGQILDSCTFWHVPAFHWTQLTVFMGAIRRTVAAQATTPILKLFGYCVKCKQNKTKKVSTSPHPSGRSPYHNQSWHYHWHDITTEPFYIWMFGKGVSELSTIFSQPHVAPVPMCCVVCVPAFGSWILVHWVLIGWTIRTQCTNRIASNTSHTGYYKLAANSESCHGEKNNQLCLYTHG